VDKRNYYRTKKNRVFKIESYDKKKVLYLDYTIISNIVKMIRTLVTQYNYLTAKFTLSIKQ